MISYSAESGQIYDSLALTDVVKKAMLDAPGRQFTPLGYVYCDSYGAELPLGIKKRGYGLERVQRELAVADLLVSSGVSGLALGLPTFTIGISYNNLPVGILTEDFTENNSVELHEERFSIPPLGFTRESMPTRLHTQVYDALKGNIYAEALGHMTGLVSSRRVLFDFDDIGFTDTPPLQQYFDRLTGRPELISRDLAV